MPTVSLEAILESKESMNEAKIKRRAEAYSLCTHGFIRVEQYKQILTLIDEYYKPMIDALDMAVEQKREEVENADSIG